MISIKLLLVLVAAAAVDADGHVGYKFEYGVDDPHTKDHKTHFEHRDGDYVVGQYTLKEADGTYRIVKYKSGPHTGFEAVVKRIGHASHPEHHGHHEEGGNGATSQIGTVHWGNQGSEHAQ